MSEPADETADAADPAQPGPSLDAPVYIPDNPGVLVKNNRQMLLELKVFPIFLIQLFQFQLPIQNLLRVR